MRIRVCFTKFFQVLPRSRLWQLLSRTIMSFWVSPRVPHCRRSVQNSASWRRDDVNAGCMGRVATAEDHFKILQSTGWEFLMFLTRCLRFDFTFKRQSRCMLPVLRAGLWMFVTGCNDVQWCAMMCNDVQWCAMVHSCVITNMLCYAGGKKSLGRAPGQGRWSQEVPIAEQGSVCLGLSSRNQSNWNHVHFIWNGQGLPSNISISIHFHIFWL